MIDYRYGTRAGPNTVTNDNKLGELGGSPPLGQLREYDAVLWQGIPEDQRNGTLFAIDAIVHDNDKLWLLAMNCNPACHPDVYDAMFETLFGPPDAKAPAAIPPASALPVGFTIQPRTPSTPSVVPPGSVPPPLTQFSPPLPAPGPTQYAAPAPAPASPAVPVTPQRNRWLS